MQQITARALRQAEWKPVYKYDSPAPGGTSFVTYASDRLPGLTVTKETRGSRNRGRFRTNTIYKFGDKRTDSPTQIVRYWNEEAKKRRGDGRPPAGSPKSAGGPDAK